MVEVGPGTLDRCERDAQHFTIGEQILKTA
jgi:hypothetical protein